MYILKFVKPSRLPVYLETDDDKKPLPQSRTLAKYIGYIPHALYTRTHYEQVDQVHCGNGKAAVVMRLAWDLKDPRMPIPEAVSEV